MLNEPQIQLSKNLIEATITKLFKRLSVCIFIQGRRGTGKTDFSLYILETLRKFKVMKVFATNIVVKNEPDIEYITNLEDLRSWASNRKGKKLFILDEAGKSISRRRPMSAINIDLINQLQILRKHKLSLILIAPADKYVDSASLGSDVLDAVVEKPIFDNPKYGVFYDLMKGERIEYIDLPRTSLKFDTWDVAPFKKDAPTRKPKFKDKDLTMLWDWSHGATAKELGIARMTIHRLSTKFVREVLERDSNK